MPVYDPYDPSTVPARGDDEDRQVLDTAIAGRAHVLATYNFGDFTSPNAVVVEAGRVQVFPTAHHNVVVMHADWVAEYLRTGRISESALP
jgi:hypothetical protein